MSRLQWPLASIVVSAAFVFAFVASAELYRYVGADGEIIVVNEIWRVPAEYRNASLAEAAERNGGSMNVVTGTKGGIPAGAAAPAPGAVDAPSASGTSPQQNSVGGHNRLWWQQESRKHADQISALERDLEAAESNDNGSGQIYSRPGHGAGPGHAKGPGHDHDRRKAAAISSANDYEPDLTPDQIRSQLDRAKSDYDRFQADARHAGVSPGWLR
jgi:hypothetical protein